MPIIPEGVVMLYDDIDITPLVYGIMDKSAANLHDACSSIRYHLCNPCIHGSNQYKTKGKADGVRQCSISNSEIRSSAFLSSTEPVAS